MIRREVNPESIVQKQIKQNNDQIETLNLTLSSETETGYGTRSKEIIAQIANLKRENERLRGTLKTTSISKRSLEKDHFGLLGRIYGIPGNRAMIYVFGAAVVMLYIGLMITSPDSFDKPVQVAGNLREVSKVDPEVSEVVPEVAEVVSEVAPSEPDPVSEPVETKPEIVTYAEALLDNPNKLNGDGKISKLTGIDLKQCARYRRMISERTINDRPIIESRQGYSAANFPKEVILKRLMEG